MAISSSNLPPTVTIDGACELLGGVSRRTVLRYTRRKVHPLPCCKLSAGARGTVVFVTEDILNWLRSLERRPPARRLRAASKARTPRPSRR